MIPATDWLLVGAITAACAVAAVALGALLVHRLTHRSVTVHLVIASLAAVATVAASVVATTRAMFLSSHDSRVVLVVTLLSVPAGAGVAIALGRSLRAASRQLATAASLVGGPTYAAASSPVTSELMAVAGALSLAHRRLADAAEREEA